MRKIVIIPSKTEDICETLVNYFKEAGWELFVMAGYSSIFEAYEEGMKTANVTAKDVVIFCHDDIHILTNKKDFNSIIDGFLQKNKIGFAGVAGTKILKESCVWWEGKQHFPHQHLSGDVYHGHTLMDMQNTHYGCPSRVVVLDGLFLVCKGATLLTLKLSQPDIFKGNWDFYDIYYTLQAHFKGLHNHVMPIQIFHKSLGEINGKEGWHMNRTALINKLGTKLPVMIN